MQILKPPKKNFYSNKSAEIKLKNKINERAELMRQRTTEGHWNVHGKKSLVSMDR